MEGAESDKISSRPPQSHVRADYFNDIGARTYFLDFALCETCHFSPIRHRLQREINFSPLLIGRFREAGTRAIVTPAHSHRRHRMIMQLRFIEAAASPGMGYVHHSSVPLLHAFGR